jgi:flagellar motor switch protein FliN/FliY
MTMLAPENSATVDDWSAALAERAASDAKPAPVAEKASFQDFTALAGSTQKNDIDFILDIPVQLTVGLGRTKIAIKNLLQLAQGSDYSPRPRRN